MILASYHLTYAHIHLYINHNKHYIIYYLDIYLSNIRSNYPGAACSFPPNSQHSAESKTLGLDVLWPPRPWTLAESEIVGLDALWPPHPWPLAKSKSRGFMLLGPLIPDP